MKVGAIIEARMDSSRLPGKVLASVLDKPMLGRLIERLNLVPEIDVIIVATTKNIEDSAICDTAERYGAGYFRGSSEDVLSRVLECAKQNSLDLIVEITGDCPLIDPSVVSKVINSYFKSDCDYVTNAHIRTYPDGMDVQVYPTHILATSAKMVNSDLEKEHVTLHIRNNPELFSRFDVCAPSNQHWPELGLTLDTKEDLDLFEILIQALEPDDIGFSLDDILNFLNDKPEVIDLNSHVVRKGDT